MDSLDFLQAVWRPQGSGYAFVCHRLHDKSWYDMAIKFPEEEFSLPDPTIGDVYFAPNLFSRPRRRRELMQPSCWLYADLDESSPFDLHPRPTVAWESSPGRYQCLVRISDELLVPKRHEILNRKLTRHYNADPSGWDATQVLRVPGTINHKREKKAEVKLLWA